jgi:hypothetical protein
VSVDVLTEIVISRPCSEVAAYAGDPSNAPHWYVNIKSVEWKSPPPLVVGSRVAFVAQFLGRRLAYTYEIVELVPAELLVMRTAEGPFPMETTYTWAPIAEGSTRMTSAIGESRAVFRASSLPSWRRRCAERIARISSSSRPFSSLARRRFASSPPVRERRRPSLLVGFEQKSSGVSNRRDHRSPNLL